MKSTTLTSLGLSRLSLSDSSLIALGAARCQRQLAQATLLCALAVFAAMAVPFWCGLVYTMDDLGGFHLPMRALYAQQLAQGKILDWTSSLFGGFYLAGEGQVGVYHPLHLLLYSIFSLRAAFCLEVLASYPFLFVGMYWFLLGRLRRRDSAMYGALAFTFTGFNLLHFVHVNAIAVIAHLPWLLWAIDRLYAVHGRNNRLRMMCVIVLLTASQLLLGYPQFVWFTLLTEAAYLVFVGQYELHPLRGLAYIAAGTLLGLTVGMVQLLPTADVLRESVRDEVTRETLVAGSLHPWNLAQLVGPYLFRKRVVAFNTHELGIYVGVVPLILAVWLLENNRRLITQGRFALAVSAFAIVILVLAMGRWGALYQLQLLLPVIGKFRFPSRYMALFALAISVLAALAFGELSRSSSPRRGSRHRENKWFARNFSPFALVIVSILVAIAAPGMWGKEHLGNLRQVLTGPILMLVAVGLLVLAERGSRKALVALAALTAIDLGCYGLSYAVYHEIEPLSQFAQVAAAPPGPSDERILADVFNSSRLRAGDRIVLAGWQRIDGYAGLEPQRQISYSSLPALRLAGVHWVARLPETETIAGLVRHDKHWFKVPGPLPRFRLVAQAKVSRHPAADIDSTPLDEVALVQRELPLAGGLPGDVTVIDDEPGHIHVRVTGHVVQLLAVAESYHSGWQARVDGLPASVERVNADFFGCVVTPGEHSVEFNFRPQSLVWGRRISAVGMSVLLVCGAIALRKKR